MWWNLSDASQKRSAAARGGSCVLFALIVLSFVSASPAAAEKPNIVLILADDLGYGDLGCYGATKIKTPNFDRIAKEGMRFTDAHSPSAVCTPTRYGILTGRYCWRSKLKQGVLNGESPMLIEQRRATIASFLKEQGYITAGIGKWHLGLGQDKETDYTKRLKPGPLDVGFNSYFGIPASLDMTPYVYVVNDGVEAFPIATSEKSPKPNYFDGVFWREGAAAPGFKHIEVLPRLTEHAEQFLAEQAQHKNEQAPRSKPKSPRPRREGEGQGEGASAPNDSPFFLYLPLTSPHTPWLPTKDYEGSTDLAENLNAYGDFVVQTDAVIGRVLDALDKHKFAENTLVIVTSDNGAMWPAKFIEQSGHRANGPWRGQKADIYEGGHRVPFLVRWPEKIKAGTTSDETICLTDIFATLADILGADRPAGAAEDSLSILPALAGDSHDQPLRKFTIHHSMSGAFAIRQGPWKAIFHLGSGGFTQPANDKPQDGGPTGQLYHLGDDPQEQHNRWLDEPEVVARLTKLLNAAKEPRTK